MTQAIPVGSWLRAQNAAAAPWLILGKGPSLARHDPADTSRRVLALNHVARAYPCDLALMMDLDVVLEAGQAIAANAKAIAMPWRPHVDNAPSQHTLDHFIQEHPLLADLAREGRLVMFNALTAERHGGHRADMPVTRVRYFSAEAGLNVLADNGVGDIRTLGVDGGDLYAEQFADLTDRTRLANGQESFDPQFGEFAATLRAHPELVFGPADMQSPARIFVGADATQLLGARVLEYSVRRWASISTTFDIIDNEGLPVPIDPERRARTGFSFCRFKIPELCGYQGRAIYVDADMQVFTDIKDLWSRDFGDAWILYSEAPGKTGRTPQYSVMLMDCEKLGWNASDLVNRLDSGEFDYASLMHEFAMMPEEKKSPDLEFEWNSLEHYEENRTKLLHYTDMPKQPWVSDRNRHRGIWYAELRRAIDDGFISLDEVYRAMELGHVSPLLPRWAGIPSHPDGARLKRNWTAPFKRFIRPRRV